MIAVVLAAGLGRRMRAPDADETLTSRQRAAADAGAKAMMPIGGGAGRPFLDYALSALADAGCSEACVVMPSTDAALGTRYVPEPGSRLQVHVAVQQAVSGTAAAVLAAEPVVGDRPFLVLNGDNLYPRDAVAALIALDGCGLAAFTRESLLVESGFPVARVARFAVVTVDAGGWVTALREKPDPQAVAASASGTLVSMNLWRMDATMFPACRDVARSLRGEFELTDAVMLAVARGTRFRALVACGPVLDLTSRTDVGIVGRALAAVEPRP